VLSSLVTSAWSFAFGSPSRPSPLAACPPEQSQSAKEAEPPGAMLDALALLAFGHFPERLLREGELDFDNLALDSATDMYDDEGEYIEPIDEVSARAQSAMAESVARLQRRFGEFIPRQLSALLYEAPERVAQLTEGEGDEGFADEDVDDDAPDGKRVPSMVYGDEQPDGGVDGYSRDVAIGPDAAVEDGFVVKKL